MEQISVKIKNNRPTLAGSLKKKIPINTVPAAGEPTISMTALLELLKDADPEVKAQLRLALLT